MRHTKVRSRRRPLPSTAAPDGRRRVRVFAFVIAALFIGLGLTNWWTNRDELRANSQVVSRSADVLGVDHVPTAYRAVYRIENRGGGPLVLNEERVWVRRPFQSRVETWKDNSRQTLRFSAFGLLASTSSGGGEPLNITAPPGLASGDLRIDAVLEEGVDRKLLLRREQREVYGRRCQVYRAGSSVLAGDVPAYEPGKGNYADICIDRNGIVLEEYWVQDEKLLRRRVATELEIDPPLDRNIFEVDVPENPGVDRGAVVRIPDDPDGEGTPLWTLDDVPEGFERLGNYAVVRSSQTVPQLGGGLPTAPPSSTSEVFVRGPDLLVIDQDPSLAVLSSFESRSSRKVDLGRLREGELLVDARMSEVRGRTAEGSFLRVFGTLPTDELVEIARSLQPGGS